MNTYRVMMRVQGGRVRGYNVDASMPEAAINRALRKMTTATSDVDVSCRLFARDVPRHYSDPKVREA